MERSGLNIFHKHFKPDLDNINPIILGGTLTSAQLMLETIIRERGFSVINKPDYSLIIYSGKFLTGIIFSERDLTSLKYILKKFIHRVEDIYGALLTDWNGDLSVFEPVKSVFNEMINFSEK